MNENIISVYAKLMQKADNTFCTFQYHILSLPNRKCKEFDRHAIYVFIYFLETLNVVCEAKIPLLVKQSIYH